MKKVITSTFLLIYAFGAGTVLLAQPVINSSVTPPVTGTVDSVYAAPATVAPGTGGAGITWNLSALSLTLGGTATVVSTSGSPYASTFPSANFCIQLTLGGIAYNYVNISATGWNTIATSYAGTGTGQNYSPDNRLEVPFPFHYTDSVTDTYQMTSGSPETESVIYDGYGTLITPLHTYTNVIRVKKNYASDYHYQWYTVNPFYLVMDYSSSGNNYIYLGETPAATAITNITHKSTAQLFPNPCIGTATLKIDVPAGVNNSSIIITDAMGRTVKQLPINTTETTIDTNGIVPGLYFYCVYNDGAQIANGKLIIQ